MVLRGDRWGYFYSAVMIYRELVYNQTFRFEAGGSLPSLKVAYHSSEGSPKGRKVIWICHALTANSDPLDWWPGMVGPGKVIDPERYFVVCVNMLGSCYGSSGPSSPCEAGFKHSAESSLAGSTVTQEALKGQAHPYLLDFPLVTVRDMVEANILVRKHLGISRVDFLLGSSIGGFQAVEWLVREPEVIGEALLMATSARITPWISAWEEAQRLCLEADPTFRHPEILLSEAGSCSGNDSDAGSCSGNGSEAGSFSGNDSDATARNRTLLRGGHEGLKAARAVAMLSYRSYEGYNRTQAEPSEDALFAQRSPSYQRHQGTKLADRFDAYSYYSLSRSVDSHNVGRGRGGVEAALSLVKARVSVVGIDSDCCFPPSEVREMAGAIPGAEYREITSAFGHDGFLLEYEQIGAIITEILNRI